MKKKELKVVDLDDLQPEDSYQESKQNQDIVIEVDAKVDVKDLDNNQKVALYNQSKKKAKQADSILKPKEGDVDLSLYSDQRLKRIAHIKDRSKIVGFMTERHKFDKKILNWFSVIVVAALLYIGLFWELPVKQDKVTVENGLLAFAQGLATMLFTMAVLLKKIYWLVIPVILYFFPINKMTKSMFEINFDGLILPDEFFFTKKPKRVRVKWKDISHIEFKKTYGVPHVEIYGVEKKVLGVMRLDVDNYKDLKHRLEIYVPEENPLRILVNK